MKGESGPAQGAASEAPGAEAGGGGGARIGARGGAGSSAKASPGRRSRSLSRRRALAAAATAAAASPAASSASASKDAWEPGQESPPQGSTESLAEQQGGADYAGSAGQAASGQAASGQAASARGARSPVRTVSSPRPTKLGRKAPSPARGAHFFLQASEAGRSSDGSGGGARSAHAPQLSGDAGALPGLRTTPHDSEKDPEKGDFVLEDDASVHSGHSFQRFLDAEFGDVAGAAHPFAHGNLPPAARSAEAAARADASQLPSRQRWANATAGSAMAPVMRVEDDHGYGSSDDDSGFGGSSGMGLTGGPYLRSGGGGGVGVAMTPTSGGRLVHPSHATHMHDFSGDLSSQDGYSHSGSAGALPPLYEGEYAASDSRAGFGGRGHGLSDGDIDEADPESFRGRDDSGGSGGVGGGSGGSGSGGDGGDDIDDTRSVASDVSFGSAYSYSSSVSSLSLGSTTGSLRSERSVRSERSTKTGSAARGLRGQLREQGHAEHRSLSGARGGQPGGQPGSSQRGRQHQAGAAPTSTGVPGAKGPDATHGPSNSGSKRSGPEQETQIPTGARAEAKDIDGSGHPLPKAKFHV